MKRIIIITFALVLVFISSCKVDKENPINDITLRGLQVYEITSERGISPYLIGIDNVLKAEEVVYAPIEKSDSLEDLYFPDYKIRSDEDSIYIKGHASIYKTNNIPIKEVGAVREYYSKGFKMTIICASEGIYNLTSDTQVQVSRLSGQDLVYPSSIYCYKLYGKGVYSEFIDNWTVIYDNYVESDTNIHYDVNYSFDSSKPLTAMRHKDDGSFWFYDGKLHMEVTGTALGDGMDVINSSLSCRNNDIAYVVNTIQCSGETKEWVITL